jgi:hypothetical protein
MTHARAGGDHAAAPMLMEPDPANAKDVTYVKLYLMVVNIVKCARRGRPGVLMCGASLLPFLPVEWQVEVVEFCVCGLCVCLFVCALRLCGYVRA